MRGYWRGGGSDWSWSVGTLIGSGGTDYDMTYDLGGRKPGWLACVCILAGVLWCTFYLTGMLGCMANTYVLLSHQFLQRNLRAYTAACTFLSDPALL